MNLAGETRTGAKAFNDSGYQVLWCQVGGSASAKRLFMEVIEGGRLTCRHLMPSLRASSLSQEFL